MQDEQHCEKALEEIQSYNFSVGMKLVGSLFQELLNCFESSSKTRKTILAALKYLLPLSTDKIKITNALSKFICEHPVSSPNFNFINQLTHTHFLEKFETLLGVDTPW